MNLQLKYIEKLKSEQILAEVYTDKYDESFCGFVVDYNPEFIVLEIFDDDCNYDGVTILLISNISRIRWAGNDLESRAYLIDISKRYNGVLSFDLSSMHAVLQSVEKLFNHINVQIQDIDTGICFIGQIHEIDDMSIVIKEYGTFSTLDRRFIMLSLDDITRIDANAQYENSLMRLYKE
ncbi:MAG: hypothetical protein IPM69_18300 [Ignavibacteria bacterium]|nr:hypothetical protein [Ignavibacteria bacterium]